jgi:hypothetical protein
VSLKHFDNVISTCCENVVEASDSLKLVFRTWIFKIRASKFSFLNNHRKLHTFSLLLVKKNHQKLIRFDFGRMFWTKKVVLHEIYNKKLQSPNTFWGRRGRDSMVVGLTTTYAISVYHHWCCECESRSGRGAQHLIKYISDLRQVGGFLRVLRFPPLIKLTATI